MSWVLSSWRGPWISRWLYCLPISAKVGYHVPGTESFMFFIAASQSASKLGGRRWFVGIEEGRSSRLSSLV
jgi:hypothetical protein